jgi:sporulation protein YlmC with PRC-barrel domain
MSAGSVDTRLDLVRDLLDTQLMDRTGRRIGRVDGVVLELRDGRPPRVAAMEVGPLAFARRIHPRFARLLRLIAVRWLPVSLRSVYLPLTLCRAVGVDIELDTDASRDRRLLRLEKWLNTHVLRYLPGSAK